MDSFFIIEIIPLFLVLFIVGKHSFNHFLFAPFRGAISATVPIQKNIFALNNAKHLIFLTNIKDAYQKKLVDVRNEISENQSANNTASNTLSTLTIAEEAISMIGPMYISEDFPDFVHFNPYTSGSTSQDISLSWIDAKRFCGQLEYNGYNDWFLPSLNQIMSYYSQNDFITITNINNFISPWDSNYNFWTNSDTGAGEVIATINIFLDDPINMSNRTKYYPTRY